MSEEQYYDRLRKNLGPELGEKFDAENLRIFGTKMPSTEQLQAKIDEMKTNGKPITMTKEYCLEWIEEELMRAFKRARSLHADDLEVLVKSEAKNIALITGWD